MKKLLRNVILVLKVTQKDSTAIPKNLLEEHITAHKQPTLGIVYDKKPFKVLLKPNKQYSWCCCGWSKNQVGTYLCLYASYHLKLTISCRIIKKFLLKSLDIVHV